MPLWTKTIPPKYVQEVENILFDDSGYWWIQETIDQDGTIDFNEELLVSIEDISFPDMIEKQVHWRLSDNDSNDWEEHLGILMDSSSQHYLSIDGHPIIIR